MKVKELKEIIEEVNSETRVFYELDYDTYSEHDLPPGTYDVNFLGFKIQEDKLTIRLSI